jgi:predicted metal-dependent phosphoesterase TrpH
LTAYHGKIGVFMQLFDIHVHTSEVSRCAKVPAVEMVGIYADAGYDGVCITNHYNRDYFESISGTWEEKINKFFGGFDIARRAGERLGLTVLPGLEIRLDGSANEYLVYGVPKQSFIECPRLYELTLRELSDFVRANGGMIFQAHPFRPSLSLADTALLDGIEVFNGNPRHNSSNYRAMGAALEHNLIMISGSDAHEYGDCGLGGMVLKRKVEKITDLLEAFRNGEYAIFLSPHKLVK